MVKPLAEFAEDRKRAAKLAKCAVCQLSKPTRQQIRAAQDAKVRRPTILAWLTTELKHAVSAQDLTRHIMGRHDA